MITSNDTPWIAVPQVNLAAAQSPSSLARRQRAQDRINRIWSSQADYTVSRDNELTLETFPGQAAILAFRVQHKEFADDRYTVFVTIRPDGFEYDCQAPTYFQRPAAPLVISLVAAEFERRSVSRRAQVAA